jgi:hypothetical protein
MAPCVVFLFEQFYFILRGGSRRKILFSGRVNWSKKVVDDGNLTAFIIRYRYVCVIVYAS